MTTRGRLVKIAQIVAVGLFLVGVVVAGSDLYSEYQSSPYMVQINDVSQFAPSSSAAYEDLSSEQKSIFDRLRTGQAAQVDGYDLELFSNSGIEYQGRYYEFEIFYDPTSFLMLDLAVGAAISVLGLGLLLLTMFARRRQFVTVAGG